MFATTDKPTTTPRSALYRKVWMLTPDSRTAQSAAVALDPEGGFQIVGVVAELSELVAGLESDPAPAAVVDIDVQPARMLRELEAVISRFPQTRFVVVCSSFSNDLILEAMEAGARHFVPKQALEADLAAVIRRLTPGVAISRDEQRGSVITILSAGGGCGATTLAVNLADELQLISHTPSLLVDMDMAYGSVATYLGLSGDYGVCDVMARQGGVDSQLVRTTAVAHSENLHVLLSPASVDLSRPVPTAKNRIEEVLAACTRAFAYTVIDAPRVPMDTAVRLASESCRTLIVGQMSVKDIRMARTIRSLLVERGIQAQSIRFVAGRYAKHTPLTLEDVERGLGGAEIDLIHNDYKAASHSINVGELLSKAAPRSSLRCDIHRMASTIAQKFQSGVSFAPSQAVAG